jgi:hypothetical protein
VEILRLLEDELLKQRELASLATSCGAVLFALGVVAGLATRGQVFLCGKAFGNMLFDLLRVIIRRHLAYVQAQRRKAFLAKKAAKSPSLAVTPVVTKPVMPAKKAKRKISAEGMRRIISYHSQAEPQNSGDGRQRRWSESGVNARNLAELR